MHFFLKAQREFIVKCKFENGYVIIFQMYISIILYYSGIDSVFNMYAKYSYEFHQRETHFNRKIRY